MRIKGNKVADKAAKEEVDVLGTAAIRLIYMEYYPVIRRTRNSK